MATRDGKDVPEQERWGSRLGFVLATAGAAVGLGNIWRFPSVTAESGGGAFVAAFLLVILLIGVPGLMAELALGRRAKRNAVDAFTTIRPGTPWAGVGALALVASFLVLSYYAVIAGWAPCPPVPERRPPRTPEAAAGAGVGQRNGPGRAGLSPRGPRAALSPR